MTAHQEQRTRRLLDHLRQLPPGTTLSTRTASALYAAWGIAKQRRIARQDLQALAARGQLVQVSGHNTTYRLNHAKERAA